MAQSILEHLGPFATQAPVSELCELTQKTWQTFHDACGGEKRSSGTQRQFIADRMMYITEVMSRGVRITSSWGLTHAAMSLLRDRYEQVVRFSWLARQPDGKEYEKFLLHFFKKTRALMRNVPLETQQQFEKITGPLPTWVFEDITKEQQVKLQQWEALDLRSMATKRDALPVFTDLLIGKESLAHWYDSIYAQMSSVSHFDMYSIEMIRVHKAPNGELVMGPQPHWPGLLILQNCYFDIIQCFEAAHAYHRKDVAEIFSNLLIEWLANSKKMNLDPEKLLRS